MTTRCGVCGTPMIRRGAKGYHCPACEKRNATYIAGRPTECSLCETPLDLNRVCPTCDHQYRVSRRFVVPSRLIDDGVLLGTCQTGAGRTRLYLYFEEFYLLQDWEPGLVSYRRFVPRAISADKAIATLRSMLHNPEIIAAGPHPDDCQVTAEGRAFLKSLEPAARKVPASRSCACATVAKRKAGKKR